MSTPPTEPNDQPGPGPESRPTPAQPPVQASDRGQDAAASPQPPVPPPSSDTGPAGPTAEQPPWQQPGPYAYPVPRSSRGTRLATAARRPRARIGAAIVAALLVGGGIGSSVTALVAGHDGANHPGITRFNRDAAGNQGPWRRSGGPANGQQPQGRFPGPSNGTGGSNGTGSSNGGTSNGTTQSALTATAQQAAGIVDINTVVGYQDAQAPGTGLVLTSSGQILTNNHVINGATKITVTVVTTGNTYPATVVGTSPTNDGAVLQLSGATGLATAASGDSSTVAVGAAVTGIGNAGGVGGTPSAAQGSVTALNQTITVSDETGAGQETLSGLIVTTAPIQAGDSGGPLYNANNKVVGIDTAAATSAASGTTSAGFAIPISSALTLAPQIDAKQGSATVHLGYPAFLGVGFSPNATSATVAEVFPGGPGAQAGLVVGDTITAVDGTAVADTTTLHDAITAHQPGDSVSLTWTDVAGASHTATASLVAGPAD